VTIFHWDHPQSLEERYGGFYNAEEVVEDFVSYAEGLFERYGDRVKHWITINEVSGDTELGGARRGAEAPNPDVRFPESPTCSEARTEPLAASYLHHDVVHGIQAQGMGAQAGSRPVRPRSFFSPQSWPLCKGVRTPADREYCSFAKSILLCHARTFDLYKKKFQPSQQGTIGIVYVSNKVAELHWGLG
jgi:hypothetical protein